MGSLLKALANCAHTFVLFCFVFTEVQLLGLSFPQILEWRGFCCQIQQA